MSVLFVITIISALGWKYFSFLMSTTARMESLMTIEMFTSLYNVLFTGCLTATKSSATAVPRSFQKIIKGKNCVFASFTFPMQL